MYSSILLGKIQKKDRICKKSNLLYNTATFVEYFLSEFLESNKTEKIGEVSFLVTDDPDRFAQNALKFYDKKLNPSDIKLIDIRG